MKKIYAILVALSALSIVLAGCGSKSDDTTNTDKKDAAAPAGGTTAK